MKALRTHVAGIDVHKEVLVITVLIGKGDEDPKAEQFECTTFTEDLMKCGQKLLDLGVAWMLLGTQMSCASYRVVPLARGVDSEGDVREFYAVAHNNIVIPEYVMNERGEYPLDRQTAWQRFQDRRKERVPQMKEKYESLKTRLDQLEWELKKLKAKGNPS